MTSAAAFPPHSAAAFAPPDSLRFQSELNNLRAKFGMEQNLNQRLQLELSNIKAKFGMELSLNQFLNDRIQKVGILANQASTEIQHILMDMKQISSLAGVPSQGGRRIFKWILIAIVVIIILLILGGIGGGIGYWIWKRRQKKTPPPPTTYSAGTPITIGL